ncbi:MAG: threonine aldolase family protein [Pseudomonadota bacterium]|nr:threonine aldolase family protein [Pseudomonadota bacterium]
MTDIDIDLYSDTQSKPTPDMRKAMAEAEVGDEQQGSDPTVTRLCEMTAELLGKEAAVFLPSGTMCNQISVAVHCRPGDEIIADRTAHIVNTEGGGLAVFAGAMSRVLDGDRGIYTADQLNAAVRRARRYTPKPRMAVIEQTSNSAGGTIWSLQAVHEVASVAQKKNLILHMDGARLLNAVVETGVSARDFAEPFDSLWVDLSKGLGCPIGAMLAGSADFIEHAWQWKQRMGGAMRQAGIVAAAGVYALEHNVDRLAEDHQNARLLAELLGNVPGIAVEEGIATNMVFFSIEAMGLTAEEFRDRLIDEAGIRIGANDLYRMRAVTHLDISSADIKRTAVSVHDLARSILVSC